MLSKPVRLAILAVMRMMILTTVCCSAAAFGGEPEAKEWQAPNGVTVKYRWSAPAAMESGKTYPVVLFLHGAGERGTDNRAQLKHGVTAILAASKKLDQPCFLIAPQCPPDGWWASIDRDPKRLSGAAKPNPLLEAVLALAADTAKHQPVDPKRFYVTGLSMGGFGTWYLLGKVPERIAAAIPICGGGDPARVADFKQVPIWAFHGEADPVVPVSSTRDMITALKQAGGSPRATYYPKVQHDSWTRTYANPEVLKWLFAQRAK